MRPRPLGPTAAFSMVEVALSLAILSVGMVGVLALLPVGLESARQVHAETVASQIVRGATADFATNGLALASYQALLNAPNGGVFRTEYFGREGEPDATAANGYFLLEYIKESGSAAAGSCRYFLRMTWPAAAAGNTNSPLIQRRVFVTDVVRNF